MANSDSELQVQLTEAGNQLLEFPSAVDDLLKLLDRVESCLLKVEQSPNKSMQNALSPSEKALISDQLLRHSDPDVKVAVASCISEITRITAPDAPYDDDKMKEVFQLIVSSFENLYDESSRSYEKRTSILETVAKVRSCVVMLDLECDDLIVEMFQHFLKAISDHHSENVFSSMETIMILVIEESEEISPELLSPLLASVRNDKDVKPISRRLGEKVIKSSAMKLKPYLIHEVENHGIVLNDYSEVVASICQETDGDAEKLAAEDKSTVRESSEEAAQMDDENATADGSSEQVDPAVDRTSKVVVNNGVALTGGVDSGSDLNAEKKQEQGEDTADDKGPSTPSFAEPDSLETEKAVDVEEKAEQASKGKDVDSSLSIKSAKPTENSLADNEEETEAHPGRKSGTKDVSNSTHEGHSAEAAEPSENEKGSDIDISSKSVEKEVTDVSPPSPSGSLPEEGRSKKAGRDKKKDSSNKDAAGADDEPKKVITSDAESKPSKRSGKKVAAGNSNENKVDAPRKESGTVSDSEAKQKSSKKASTVNSLETKSSVEVEAPIKESGAASDSEGKQKSVKKVDGSSKRARSKVPSRRGAAKSPAKDEDKEMMSTQKLPSKSTKEEPLLEETPKTSSKRKRAPEKEKGSDVKQLNGSLVGSKVKVYWPEDRMFYEGVVHSYDSAKRKHLVKYNDGDEENLNLTKEKWELIEDDSGSDGEHETDLSSHDTSSDEVPLNKKAKMNESTKKGKMDALPKSGGGASSSKSKGRPIKSGRKSKGGTPKSVGKSDDEPVGKLKDQASKSGGSKSGNVALKTSSKSKKNESQTPKSAKSKEDNSSTQRAATKSKQETQKAKTPTTKGKSSLSSSKADANGTGKKKSGAMPKDSDDMDEDSTDSEKPVERTKGKSVSSSKAQGSQTKSGKKRRRGTKG